MRQFISNKNPENGILTLVGKDFRYLHQVLRLSVGDMFCVRVPNGELLNTTVAKIDENEKKIILQICDLVSETNNLSENLPNASLKEIVLFMFVPKPSKFELIVRQATECGVSKIIPVASEYSQKGAEKMNFKGERFERIIKEARQQSGSAVNTQVESVVSLKEACEIWKKETESEDCFGCALYERSDFTVSMKEAFAEKSNIRKAAIVVGSEGGISPEEIKILKDSGFIPVHFKTNILRCETAALYGIAVLQNLIEN